MKSTFNGTRVIDTGITFRIEKHHIIGDCVFNVKHIDIDMDEAILMVKTLQKAIQVAKKRDIRNFGYVYSLKEEREKYK